MIINGEFTVQGGDLFKNYALKNEEQFSYTFPTFTIGEGATCTILSPNNPKNFKFSFSSRTDLADLCVIPLTDFKNYCEVTDKMGTNGDMHFTSFGKLLHDTAESETIKLFKTLSVEKSEIDIVFTHASSKNEWQKYGDIAGIGDKIYHIYQKTGNLVSASVPAAIVLALDEGKLKKGDRVFSWVGSAGMSFSGCLYNL
jgi:3-oxoacyl-[acyl-carrier-protein] synthase III